MGTEIRAPPPPPPIRPRVGLCSPWPWCQKGGRQGRGQQGLGGVTKPLQKSSPPPKIAAPHALTSPRSSGTADCSPQEGSAPPNEGPTWGKGLKFPPPRVPPKDHRARGAAPDPPAGLLPAFREDLSPPAPRTLERKRFGGPPVFHHIPASNQRLCLWSGVQPSRPPAPQSPWGGEQPRPPHWVWSSGPWGTEAGGSGPGCKRGPHPCKGAAGRV